jgi:esterase/lipase superfamily enzyme
VSERLRIANVVLFAPDIDRDVASSKIFSAVSDPDLSYGSTRRPFGAVPPGNLLVTVSSSPGDKALGLLGLLFGSVLRLGQLAPAQQDPVFHMLIASGVRTANGMVRPCFCPACP